MKVQIRESRHWHKWETILRLADLAAQVAEVFVTLCAAPLRIGASGPP